MSTVLTDSIIWQLYACELRERMAAWSDQQLEEFAQGFRGWDHDMPRAYLAEVSRERQRRVIDQKRSDSI